MNWFDRLRHHAATTFVNKNESREAPEAVAAREVVALAGIGALRLLKALKAGLEENAEEFTRYQAAEALADAVYPKFKFSEYGRLFLEDRAFIAFYERHMDVGNWHSLDRKYTLNEMLKLVAHIEGDIAECGCYKGYSSYLMCQAARGSTAVVHLFDSFEGLPEPEPKDGDYWVKGALTSPEEMLHQTLAEFDNYRIYKGWIPARFDEVVDRHFRFVHVDVDLYRPTLDSLEFFYPRMQPNGIMLFDDYGFTTCPGAKAATDEFFADKRERIAMMTTGQALIVKQ